MIDWLALAVALTLLGSVLAAAIPSRSPGIGMTTGLLTTTAVLFIGVLIAHGGEQPLQHHLLGFPQILPPGRHTGR
jgi:hypothetical protein